MKKLVLVAVALGLMGCGDNYPHYEPNFVTKMGMQVYIPHMDVLYNGPDNPVYDKGEIANIISFWIDYRTNNWLSFYKTTIDKSTLLAIALRQTIVVINGWYIPCKEAIYPNFCRGMHYPNNILETVIYAREGHLLDAGKYGFPCMEHELEHAMGLKQGEMSFCEQHYL